MTLNLKALFQQQAKGWSVLDPEFSLPYMHQLSNAIEKHAIHHPIYPDAQNIFSAYALTPLSKVKVVIVGQDPYHGPGQAHGLSFSVLDPTPIPPSLKNMYKELASDLNIPIPQSGNLSSWAKQGVFLLNAVLTVNHKQANSHKNLGWEKFTQKTISTIAEQQQNVVFILWGGYAQKLKKLIPIHNHHIIESPHPSPLSSYRGFFDSKPYSKTNAYLTANNITPINWNV